MTFANWNSPRALKAKLQAVLYFVRDKKRDVARPTSPPTFVDADWSLAVNGTDAKLTILTWDTVGDPDTVVYRVNNGQWILVPGYGGELPFTGNLFEVEEGEEYSLQLRAIVNGSMSLISDTKVIP